MCVSYNHYKSTRAYDLDEINYYYYKLLLLQCTKYFKIIHCAPPPAGKAILEDFISFVAFTNVRKQEEEREIIFVKVKKIKLGNALKPIFKVI